MHKIWVFWLILIYRNPFWKNIFWKCIKGALLTSVHWTGGIRAGAIVLGHCLKLNKSNSYNSTEDDLVIEIRSCWAQFVTMFKEITLHDEQYGFMRTRLTHCKGHYHGQTYHSAVKNLNRSKNDFVLGLHEVGGWTFLSNIRSYL